MKKIIAKSTLLLAVILTTGILGISTASANSFQKDSKETAGNEIIRKLSYPAFLGKDGGSGEAVVKAIIRIDKTGKIEIRDVDTRDQKLKAYVIEKLQQMKLHNTDPVETFQLVIQFKIV